MFELGYQRKTTEKPAAPAEQQKKPEAKTETLPVTPDEQLLMTREVADMKELEGGTNLGMKIIQLKDDGRAIFKPQEGEFGTRDDIEEGTFFKRERAAYVVDRMLGLGIMPATVIREVNGKIGSCQQFVENGKTMLEEIYENMAQRFHTRDVEKITKAQFHELKQEFYARHAAGFQSLKVFDVAILNSDRHDNNFLIQDGKIVPIDHGLSFGDEKPLFAHESFDQPFSPDLIKKLNDFASSDEKVESLRIELYKLLDKKDANACILRIKKMALILQKHGQFPSSFKDELTY
jgi:hypothetical protein